AEYGCRDVDAREAKSSRGPGAPVSDPMQSAQAKFLLILLAGDQHRAVAEFGFEQGLLIDATGERQGNLTAFGGAALHGEHDFSAQAGVLEIALMHFPAVV